MKFHEEVGDLFSVKNTHVIVYPIAANAKCSDDISKLISDRFDMSSVKQAARTRELSVGSCFGVGNVMRLITKERDTHRTTYEHLAWSLVALRSLCDSLKINKLAMPRVCCDGDKLDWNRVRQIIFKTFGTRDIEIVVYTPLGEDKQ